MKACRSLFCVHINLCVVKGSDYCSYSIQFVVTRLLTVVGRGVSASLSIATEREVLQNTVVMTLGAGVGEYTVSLSDPVSDYFY